jgi:sec-independent protein translocase protein TatB
MSILPTIEIASLGMWDSLILMVMALVVFGPRRMPEIGRQIGKLMYELRKASSDFKFQIEEELRNTEEADRQKKDAERLPALAPPAGTIEAGSRVGESGAVDSPVPEAGADAVPGAPATNAWESPYPGDNRYPYSFVDPAVAPETAVVVPETPAEEGAEQAALPGSAASAASRADGKAAEDPGANPEEIPTEPVNRNG